MFGRIKLTMNETNTFRSKERQLPVARNKFARFAGKGLNVWFLRDKFVSYDRKLSALQPGRVSFVYCQVNSTKLFSSVKLFTIHARGKIHDR